VVVGPFVWLRTTRANLSACRAHSVRASDCAWHRDPPRQHETCTSLEIVSGCDEPSAKRRTVSAFFACFTTSARS
jgi:hypothetical protein